MTRPRALGGDRLDNVLAGGAVVIDARPPDQYDAGHVAGSLNVPVDAGPGRAGAIVRPLLGREAVTVVAARTPVHARMLAESLERAGFRAPLAVLDGDDGEDTLRPHRTRTAGAIGPERLAGELATGAVLLLDVREPDEWADAHLPGSAHLPLDMLRTTAHLLPDVPIVVACSDGLRSAAAASAMRRWGHRNIWRVAGGGIPDLLARPVGLDLLGAA